MTSTIVQPVTSRPAVRIRDNELLGFAARRLGRFVVSLWIVVTAAFLMIHLVPGDPVRAAMGTNAPSDLVEARREALGLNDSLLTQYWHFIQGLFSGDLGTSLVTNQPVTQVVSDRMPETLQLAVLAFILVAALALPIGVTMAVATRGGRRRGGELAFATICVVVAAVPEFLLAVAFVYLFAVQFAWFPVAGADGGASYVLPVVTLALGPAAVMARIVRVETLSVLGNDFIRTARAKRLPPRLVYLRHALPNALTATLTIAGLLLTSMVAGTVLVEQIFAWPGLGSMIVQSILQKDYPMVQGIVLVYGCAVLLVHLVVDVLLGVLDPRSTIRES